VDKLLSLVAAEGRLRIISEEGRARIIPLVKGILLKDRFRKGDFFFINPSVEKNNIVRHFQDYLITFVPCLMSITILDNFQYFRVNPGNLRIGDICDSHEK
jgi:hypothetical protein